MKNMKLALTVAASAMLLSSPAMAFHSGGVAECEGCHTMHNSLDDQVMAGTGKGRSGVNVSAIGLVKGQSGPYLLQGSDQSSACLNCHQDPGAGSYHIATPMDPNTNDATKIPYQYSPGGDFAWLKKNYTYSLRGSLNTVEGQQHGHNIVAADYGFVADSNHAVAPIGNSAITPYDANNFYCSSCHDPHGKFRRLDSTAATFSDGKIGSTTAPIYTSGSYGAATTNGWAIGAYRILGGNGYKPKSASNGAGYAAPTFVNDPPVAVAPSTYSTSAGEASNEVVVAYGEGMSEWCGNCHAGMHLDSYTSGTAKLVHPAGNGAKFTQAIADNYNAYVKTGTLTGTQATAYSSLVPFELGTANSSTLAAFSNKAAAFNSKQGPSTTNNVMCLSCHRAHATGFESMLRYGITDFITVVDSTGNVAYPANDDAVNSNPGYSEGRSLAEMKAAYYQRPATYFSAYQRAYCNKCHVKD